MRKIETTIFIPAETEIESNINRVTETLVGVQNIGSSASSSASSRKTVVLDVRSDIYGLGATLYHLLTGHRPQQKAIEVIPLSEKEFSPRIAEIINKAMNPNPDLRYQTAEEMLFDLNHLHESDPRTKRHKRISFVAGLSLTTLLGLGVFASFVGLKQMEWIQSSYAFSEYSANALLDGDIPQAINYSLQALPDQDSIFIPPYTSQAKKALADALGVYDLSDGTSLLKRLHYHQKR